MNINERLAFLRKYLKLTQVVFAKDISISNGYLASMELGNRRINHRIIRLICSTYNVNKRWLETGEGEMFFKPPHDKLDKVRDIFNQLHPSFQDFVLNQMDSLILLQNHQDAKDGDTEDD